MPLLYSQTFFCHLAHFLRNFRKKIIPYHISERFSAIWSVNLKIMGIARDASSAANIALSARNFDLCVNMMEMHKSLVVLEIFAVVLIAVLYWFFGTEAGSAIRATGCNQAMAKAQGININFCKVFALALSNGIVAMAGALLAQQQGAADILHRLRDVYLGDLAFSFEDLERSLKSFT